MDIDTGGVARTNLKITTVCYASKLIEKHLHRYIRLQISNRYPTEAQWSHLETTARRVMKEVATEQQHDIHPLAVCYVCDVHICHPDRHYVKPDLGKQHYLFKPRLSLFENYVITRTHKDVKVTDGGRCFSQSPISLLDKIQEGAGLEGWSTLRHSRPGALTCPVRESQSGLWSNYSRRNIGQIVRLRCEKGQCKQNMLVTNRPQAVD